MKNTPFTKKDQALKERKHYIMDASGKTLGRFATEISKILRGKHKVNYTPTTDVGDAVIIINAEKIKVTGSKEARKTYRSYTGWVGGFREVGYREIQAKKPEFIIYHAVKGMMPKKSKLARQQLKKLRIFKGEEHNLKAQKPTKLDI